jgi:hypothetical protein
MELRLPRRPRIFVAQQPTRGTGAETVPEDDAWAGEDDAWTADDDTAADGGDEFIRSFRGAVVGAIVGAVLWGLVALALVLVLWLT